ncbi:MAG: hypothetical protein V1875_05355 [Candidatus Altiarchaeota archaeon]
MPYSQRRAQAEHPVPGLLAAEDFRANVKAAVQQALAVDSGKVKFVLDRSTGKARSVAATDQNPKEAIQGETDQYGLVIGYLAKAGADVTLLYVHSPQSGVLGADATDGSQPVFRVLKALAESGLPEKTLTLVTMESFVRPMSSSSATTVYMNNLKDFARGKDYIPRQ